MIQAGFEKAKQGNPKQRKNKWTEQEVEFLRRNYRLNGGMSTREIANLLGHSRVNVRYTAQKLKLFMHPVKVWTQKEEQFLRKNFRKMTHEEMGRRLGRSKDSVMRKLHAGLKLNKYSQHRWTASEWRLLKQLYGKIASKDVARRLNISVGMVRRRASECGLTQDRKYIQSEKEFIRKNYFTMLNADIAKCLNRSTSSVGATARKLGLAGTPQKMALGREAFRKMMRDKHCVKKTAKSK
jgi:DNA-binding CsgD family transcriptional regulator